MLEKAFRLQFWEECGDGEDNVVACRNRLHEMRGSLPVRRERRISGERKLCFQKKDVVIATSFFLTLNNQTDIMMISDKIQKGE